MKIQRIDQSFVAARSFFYIDGEIVSVGDKGKRLMANQMFVEAYFPREQAHPYPIVMLHGALQTNMNWLTTPDGRMGFADYFVSKGYAVYLCEQPARGRSDYHAEVNGGPRRADDIEVIRRRFMSAEDRHPQSKLHSQWPGTAAADFSDPVDRQFLDAQVESLPSNAESQRLVLQAVTKLLREIGPAVLMTHSQAGPLGWLIADACPELV